MGSLWPRWADWVSVDRQHRYGPFIATSRRLSSLSSVHIFSHIHSQLGPRVAGLVAQYYPINPNSPPETFARAHYSKCLATWMEGRVAVIKIPVTHTRHHQQIEESQISNQINKPTRPGNPACRIVCL